MYYSFFDYHYVRGFGAFVGLGNYTYLLGDLFFQVSVRNTAVFAVVATLIQVTLGLGPALLFDQRFPGRQLLIPRMIFPMIISTMVVSAIWRAWYHYDCIGEVRGIGAMLAIELVRDRATREPAPECAVAAIAEARNRGVLLLGAGAHGNVVRLSMPLVISDAQLSQALEALDEAASVAFLAGTDREQSVAAAMPPPGAELP